MNQEILDALDDAVFATDDLFRVSAWNKAAERAFGWTAAEVMGRPAPEVLGTRRADSPGSVFPFGGSFEGEVTHHDKSGRRLLMEMRTTALRSHRGEVTGYLSVNRDLSKWREAQGRIRENERRWRSLLENVRLAAVSLNTEGIVTYVNPYFLEATGHELTDVIGKDWFERFVPAPHRAAAREIFETLIQEGQQASNWHPVRTRSDRTIEVNWFNTPLRDPAGRIIGVQSLGEDVTARRSAEDEARKQKKLLDSIIRCIGDGVVVTDYKGNFLAYNPAAEKIVGLKEKETSPEGWAVQQGATLADQATPYPAGDFPLARVLRGESVTDEEHFVRNARLPEGAWVSVTARPLMDEEGIRQGGVIILRDVTDRRNAQRHLAFQSRILSQVQDAVVATNAEDEITLWNPAAVRLYGIAAGETVGRKLSETVLSNWIKPDHHKAVEAAIRERGLWHGTALQKRSDGREMHVEMTISMLKDDQGNPQGLLTVARDISEKKQVESQLLHSEKLMAMGRLAAGVSHELKAPIGVIYSHADLLLGRDRLPTVMKKALETMKAHALRCVHLIDHLMEFSRKERPPEKEVFDVQDALSFPLSVIGPPALRNNVKVRRELEPTPMKVLGHKDMFEQVVVSLALNAIDAMPQGGVLTLRSKRGELNGRPAVRVEVSDTGPGISPDVQRKMFEPFFTTKEKGKGTGLGLWMAKEITDALGGDLKCRSESGKGTTFELQVPLINSSRDGAENMAEVPSGRNP